MGEDHSVPEVCCVFPCETTNMEPKVGFLGRSQTSNTTFEDSGYESAAEIETTEKQQKQTEIPRERTSAIDVEEHEEIAFISARSPIEEIPPFAVEARSQTVVNDSRPSELNTLCGAQPLSDLPADHASSDDACGDVSSLVSEASPQGKGSVPSGFKPEDIARDQSFEESKSLSEYEWAYELWYQRGLLQWRPKSYCDEGIKVGMKRSDDESNGRLDVLEKIDRSPVVASSLPRLDPQLKNEPFGDGVIQVRNQGNNGNDCQLSVNRKIIGEFDRTQADAWAYEVWYQHGLITWRPNCVDDISRCDPCS